MTLIAYSIYLKEDKLLIQKQTILKFHGLSQPSGSLRIGNCGMDFSNVSDAPSLLGICSVSSLKTSQNFELKETMIVPKGRSIDAPHCGTCSNAPFRSKWKEMKPTPLSCYSNDTGTSNTINLCGSKFSRVMRDGIILTTLFTHMGETYLDSEFLKLEFFFWETAICENFDLRNLSAIR